MTLFWILFPIFVYLVVLSWTDLQSHVGYAFNVSLEEGLWKFPVIWIQSFMIHSCFLKTGRSKYDYDTITNLERALRLAYNKEENDITVSIDSYRDTLDINGHRSLYYKIENGSNGVEVCGSYKLIPPRLAFMMMDLYSKCEKETDTKKRKEKTSILN